MKTLFVLSLLLCSQTLSAQTSLPPNTPIPLQTVELLQNWVGQAAMDYRLLINPELKKENLQNVSSRYYSAQEIILKDTAFRHRKDPMLVLKISRWPEKHPIKNWYVLTKHKNLFARINQQKGFDAKRGQFMRDTVIYLEYDQYNQYYPGDNRFLVYYDPMKDEYGNATYKQVSGNFIQDEFNRNWWDVNHLATMIEFRLEQYNAQLNPEIHTKEVDKHKYIFLKNCIIHSASGGKCVVKARNGNDFEILYYSNYQGITGDENLSHFYEVKYVRNFQEGTYPQSYADTQPTIRRISTEERRALETLLGRSIYEFGDVERRVPPELPNPADLPQDPPKKGKPNPAKKTNKTRK